MGAPRLRPAGQDAGGVRHPRLDRGEGDRPRRRAPARRRRFHQPAAAEDAAAIRPDDRLRHRRRQRHPRPRHPAQRDRQGDPLQHLRHRGIAARARSPIPAAPRSRPWPIRRAPRTSISSPTAPAATSSPRRSISTTQRRALAPGRGIAPGRPRWIRSKPASSPARRQATRGTGGQGAPAFAPADQAPTVTASTSSTRRPASKKAERRPPPARCSRLAAPRLSTPRRARSGTPW